MTRCRVLHVTGPLDRGGVETWLLHMVRHIDRSRYPMDFLIRGDRPGAYAEEIERLGSRVVLCPGHPNPWRFGRNFLRGLRTDGPYDVVHSHIGAFSGVTMYLAARGGVPVRIAHCHSDRRTARRERTPAGRVYRRVMRSWIKRYATRRVAVSRPAAEYLFGPSWSSDRATAVIRCGLDLTPFGATPPDGAARGHLGLPDDAIVIGHVGRFVPEKNHVRLLEAAAATMQRDRRVRLLMIGEGPLRARIEARARAMGMADRAVFAGGRDDVPAIMLSAMDVFIFPSLHEAMPLALIEAQSAGLPCVVSDRVPEEADVVKELIRRLSLDASPEQWAAAALEAARHRPVVDRAAALQRVLASDFNIANSVRAFCALYDGCLDKHQTALTGVVPEMERCAKGSHVRSTS